MKRTRKTLCFLLTFCLIIGCVTMMPQTGQAASNFVIKNGTLVEYKGSAKVVTIPKGVTDIGNNAFQGNKTITKVTIPKGVEVIGNNAFRDCENLKTVKLPSTVWFISKYAFYNCTSLTTINIPKAVDTIYEFAFINTPWLEKQQQKRKDSLVIINNLLIDGQACSGSITIPKGVKEIGRYAFAENENITKVTFPTTVKYINECAFMNCENLTQVSFSKGLKTIKDYAFFNCINLKSVKFPSTMENIKSYAFYNCDSLKSVTLPKTKSESLDALFVYKGAFGACDSLTKITILNKKPILENIWIDGTDIFSPPYSMATQDFTVDIEEYQKQLPDTITIRGYKNSYTQEFVKNYKKKPYAHNHVVFEAIE